MTGFRVTGLYHPSHHVPDLAEAEDFFERVFGRSSRRLSSLAASSSSSPSPSGSKPSKHRFSNDYCTFTSIADVLVDCIDPTRYVVDGHHPYEPVERPTLRAVGWYVEGIDHLYRAMRAVGLTVVDQLDRVADGDHPPTAIGAPMPLFFTDPTEVGLRHELLPPIPFPLDHRQVDGWTLGPPSPDDPLGILRCTHHTIVTADPDRALRFLVDVLGGEVVHVGRDELLDVEATFVELAGTVIELAAPTDGEVGDDERGDDGGDDYRSIAFEVLDLAKVEAHLADEGVGVVARANGAVLTDPATSLGVAWRFTERSR